jgi:hypothetical protein
LCFAKYRKPSGWIGDFQHQAIEHAVHTTGRGRPAITQHQCFEKTSSERETPIDGRRSRNAALTERTTAGITRHRQHRISTGRGSRRRCVSGSGPDQVFAVTAADLHEWMA